MDRYSYLSNADTIVVDQLYEAWKQDNTSVDESWNKFFEGFEFSMLYGGGVTPTKSAALTYDRNAADVAPAAGHVQKEMAVYALIQAYRLRGHLESNTNPVRPRKDRSAKLALADFGLTDADKGSKFAVGSEIGLANATLAEIEAQLKKIYSRTIGFEVAHVRNTEQQAWLREQIEQKWPNWTPSLDQKKHILSKLNEAVVFENFLHTKYIGQKRFSLEGGETTIAALDAVINKGAEVGVEEVVIGMAHRGRLNVLANIMGKTYEQIFTEFEGTATPDLTMGSGDVKYHLGFAGDKTALNGKKVSLKLCPNPSHLEAVNSVLEGFTRSKVDSQFGNDYTKIIPVLIHGDAAVAGQGVVYEVTQMARLAGYTTGGTFHLVINNQVGFTTDFDDARSGTYCTDVAKVVDAPVFHVNGDDPEAVVFCTELAMAFRQQFAVDVFVDMVCYRRHGHNESDEPKFTQPKLYNIIAKHPNPREVYNEVLITRGDVDAELAKNMDKAFRDLLQDRLNLVKQSPLPYQYTKLEVEWNKLRRSNSEDFAKSPKTAISQEVIEKVGKALTTVPAGFKPLKQIEKLLKEREEMFFKDGQFTWAAAELLAYGSLLLEGKTVRLAGQDVERGTFSHRHAVLRDSVTNESYNSLNNISAGQAKLNIFNSLLSEYAAMGFEFGYAMANPHALTIWEAQFGDFVNGAQVMIDQFLASCESKWQIMNGLVLLLPHGYEGQGPEHSSARLERFLQLAAEDNMVVANMTTPANLFHFMRRQLTWEFRKPAVVMSPKSMLRHPNAISPIEEFKTGSFKEVIGDKYVTAKSVKRVLLVSGKFYYELLEKQQAGKRKDVAVIRVEQLYPFPASQIHAELAKYKGAEVFWVQEEPENSGACTFVLHQMRKSGIDFIARKASASPATGYGKVHAKEQAELLTRAFDI